MTTKNISNFKRLYKFLFSPTMFLVFGLLTFFIYKDYDEMKARGMTSGLDIYIQGLYKFTGRIGFLCGTLFITTIWYFMNYRQFIHRNKTAFAVKDKNIPDQL